MKFRLGTMAFELLAAVSAAPAASGRAGLNGRYSMASGLAGRVKVWLMVGVYFVALLFAATPTMGPQAAVGALLFWIWVLKPGDRGRGQTAAGLVVILLLALDGPMPWQWRDPGLPLWLAFGTLVLLPGVLVWWRVAGPRFEEPEAKGELRAHKESRGDEPRGSLFV